MKVLSLFDGISCGRVALERAGIKVSRYVAVEIDGYAQIISRKNHKDIQHFGDVCKVDFEEGEFDLILAGSPCQGFSSAGLGLGFADERSKLYYEFLRIKNKVKPKYWLLENVSMKQIWQEKISYDLWQTPIEINSALLSAQNRKRLYWSNIPFESPQDKGVSLQDILIFDKTLNECLQVSSGSRRSRGDEWRKDNKSYALLADGHQSRWLCQNGIFIRKLFPIECERLQTLPDDYTKGISNAQRYKTIGNGWTVDVIAHILSHIPK